MKQALIIGGGFAGCAAAHQLTLIKGWDITMIEGTNELGAGVRTRFKGGHPYTFGPRHFLSDSEKAYSYLSTFLEMRDCSEHEFKTYVESDAKFYNYPIHMDDIQEMPDKDRILDELSKCDYYGRNLRFDPAGKMSKAGKIEANNLEEFWLKSVGPTLYKKFVENYNKKMWCVDDNSLIDIFGWSPKGVTIKTGERASWDDSISAYPISYDGYNSYFELAVAEAKVYYNIDALKCVDLNKKILTIGGNQMEFDIIINTISIDLLMEQRYGELPYIGRNMEFIIMPSSQVLPDNIFFAYYAGHEKYTRITEYKKLTKHQVESQTTLISLEYPSNKGRYYPLPMKKYKRLYQRYMNDLEESIFSIGRAGSYDYGIDIDDSILQAIEIAENLK